MSPGKAPILILYPLIRQILRLLPETFFLYLIYADYRYTEKERKKKITRK